MMIWKVEKVKTSTATNGVPVDQNAYSCLMLNTHIDMKDMYKSTNDQSFILGVALVEVVRSNSRDRSSL